MFLNEYFNSNSNNIFEILIRIYDIYKSPKNEKAVVFTESIESKLGFFDVKSCSDSTQNLNFLKKLKSMSDF